MTTPLPLKHPATNFRVYKRRWAILLLFGLLTMLSNVLCFSFASISHYARVHYRVKTSEINYLVSVYFLSYIPTSILGSWLLNRYGLRFGVITGAALQTIGATARFISCSLDQGFYPVLVGQFLASLAQPFFVNSPPMLAACWFSDRERTLATTVAVEANVLGIAAAFLIGPVVVSGPQDLPFLLMVYAVSCCVLFITALTFFQDRPPTPPSPAAATSDSLCDTNWRQWFTVFRQKGFAFTVVAFAVAETVLNIIPIFLNQTLISDNPTATPADHRWLKHFVGLLGAGFIISGVFGSVVASKFIDVRPSAQRYKATVAVSFLLSATAMAAFTLASDASSFLLIAFSVLSVGLFIGGIEPVGTELGVECAYPMPEATVAAVQQLAGQFGSLGFVPLLDAVFAATHGMTVPNFILTGLLVLATCIFCFFNGDCRRLESEQSQYAALISKSPKSAAAAGLPPPHLGYGAFATMTNGSGSALPVHNQPGTQHTVGCTNGASHTHAHVVDQLVRWSIGEDTVENGRDAHRFPKPPGYAVPAMSIRRADSNVSDMCITVYGSSDTDRLSAYAPSRGRSRANSALDPQLLPTLDDRINADSPEPTLVPA